MKTRSGFVSNSSSSSFTCNVCGENQSGMDLSRSDCDMFECEHGHTVCNTHKRSVEITDEDKKALLLARLAKRTWKTPEQIASDTAEINASTDEELAESYHEACYDGSPSSLCPICSFEKLDDTEGLLYLLKKSGLTREQLATQIGNEFKTFTVFSDYILPPKPKA
jgi:hypothetical protein